MILYLSLYRHLRRSWRYIKSPQLFQNWLWVWESYNITSGYWRWSPKRKDVSDVQFQHYSPQDRIHLNTTSMVGRENIRKQHQHGPVQATCTYPAIHLVPVCTKGKVNCERLLPVTTSWAAEFYQWRAQTTSKALLGFVWSMFLAFVPDLPHMYSWGTSTWLYMLTV